MDRDQILQRSRQQQRDEWLEYVENNGRKLGFAAFCCVVIFEVLLNSYLGEQSYAIFALFWTFLAVESIPKYRFTKKKAYLITAIAGSIAAVASLVGFVFVSVR